MRLVDEKGKLFGRINVIDFSIIVLVIVLGFGAYYKFHVLDKTSTVGSMEPMSYTVEVKKIRNYVFQNVKEGDLLFDKTSGKSIGKIVKVEGVSAKEALLCTDGTYRLGEVENRVDVTFTIEAKGIVNEDGYFVHKTYELVSGSERKFMTKYFECDGKVKDIL